MGFERWTGSDPPYGAPLDPEDVEGGGHDVSIDGYEDQPDGSTVFWVASSWGATDFGIKGRIRCSEAWLNDRQNGDLCVLAVKG